MLMPGRRRASRFTPSLTVATNPGEVNLLACHESSAPVPARPADGRSGPARRAVGNAARGTAGRGARAAGAADRPRRPGRPGRRPRRAGAGGGSAVSAPGGPAAQKISASHLGRDAYVYIRQSTQAQVTVNTESLARQYELAGRAGQLGWHAAQVVTIDADLGRSGARS